MWWKWEKVGWIGETERASTSRRANERNERDEGKLNKERKDEMIVSKSASVSSFSWEQYRIWLWRSTLRLDSTPGNKHENIMKIWKWSLYFKVIFIYIFSKGSTLFFSIQNTTTIRTPILNGCNLNRDQISVTTHSCKYRYKTIRLVFLIEWHLYLFIFRRTQVFGELPQKSKTSARWPCCWIRYHFTRSSLITRRACSTRLLTSRFFGKELEMHFFDKVLVMVH